MAGNTGKMTKEQIKQRGPRMVLARFAGSRELFIFTEGKPTLPCKVIARSYSRSYLEKIAKANK